MSGRRLGPGRVEAFTDGVVAIIITIMVLELHVPEGPTLEDLSHSATGFLTYLLSFVYIGIYWNNHHHLLQAARHVSGGVLWANLHLLFWLSLVPVVTHWMGDTHFAPTPVAAYGAVLLMAGVAYMVLTRVLVRVHGKDSPLALAVGGDSKGVLSVVVYALAIPGAFVRSSSTWLPTR